MKVNHLPAPKGCPFCGGSSVYPIRQGFAVTAAECIDCGARGPTVSNKFEIDPEQVALERWGERVGVTATDAY